MKRLIDVLNEWYLKGSAVDLLSDIDADIDALQTKSDELSNKVSQSDKDIEELKHAVLSLEGAMHFKGIIDSNPTSENFADGYDSGDVVIYGDKEYICQDVNGVKSFVEFGDTSDYLLKTVASGTYVTKTELSNVSNQLSSSISAKVNQSVYDKKIVELAQSDIDNLQSAKSYTDECIGNIDSAIDNIIYIQNGYIAKDFLDSTFWCEM